MLTIGNVELPPEPSSVPAAREIVGDVAGHLPRQAREAAQLVASELAANSVVHAGTPFEVFAAADDSAIEVLVADHAGWVAAPDGTRAPGHGLLLVGLLASDWAAVIEGAGKRVWARLEAGDVPSY